MEKLKGIKTTREKNAGKALAASIAENPELRQSILNEPNNVRFYDKNAPSVKQRRARFRQEFLDVIRSIKQLDTALSDDEVYKLCMAPDVVVNLHLVRILVATHEFF